MANRDEFYPFLVGERLYLREVRTDDVGDRYYRWMNDPEVTEFLESRYFPNSMESIAEFVSQNLGSRTSLFLAIVQKQDHRHIGNIKAGPIDWIHRIADVGIVIGERDCWGHGFASEAIQLVRQHAFESLNLHKLTAACCVSNEGSRRAFEKAGFAVEGTRRAHAFRRGRYEDVWILGVVNE